MEEHPVSHLITPTGKVIKVKRLTYAAWRRSFKPYGEALGFLAYSWNRLHDSLAKLFVAVIDQRFQRVPEGIWYSTDNDFAQRQMLRAAAKESPAVREENKEDIKWVLNKIDTDLRHGRNDAIHAPLAQAHRIEEDGFKVWFRADIFSVSPRARSLQGKNLLDEFKKHAELALTLARYVDNMKLSVISPKEFAWPDRPQLPHAHQKKSRKPRSRRSRTK